MAARYVTLQAFLSVAKLSVDVFSRSLAGYACQLISDICDIGAAHRPPRGCIACKCGLVLF
jgi:hypothetical protein